MPDPVPCCVDVPSGAALLRYGLEELLRGLGLAPAWTRSDDARLVVSLDRATEAGRLALAVTARALADLDAPRRPAVRDLGWVAIDREDWPLPVGPAGPCDALGDLVASAAWWLAGLQERAVRDRDHHGRFPYGSSLQAGLAPGPGGPLRPAVDAYRQRLAEGLRGIGIEPPGRTWGGNAWAVALSHDLDAVRTGRLRSGMGGLVRRRPVEALRRVLGPDRRLATIDALADLGQRHGAAATWFVKPGRWAPEDMPVDLGGRALDRLRALGEGGGEIGWHPGYGAHDHPGRLAAERERFEAAFGHAPAVARTHFLRWTEPATPRLLAAHGVRLDSTLGFAAHEGYRRGTSHPFRWFDLDADRATDLWELPLALMDTTLTDYRRVDPEAAGRAVRNVLAAARAAGGVAVVLWHNQVGGPDAEWDTRLDTLDRELGRARADGARLGALEALLDGWIGSV